MSDIIIIINEETITKREKIKGHYRIVTRGKESGRIVTSKKWSPPKSPCIFCYNLDVSQAYQEDPEEYKNPRICYGYCREYKQYRYSVVYYNCKNPKIGNNIPGWLRWIKNKKRGLERYVEAFEEMSKQG